MTLSSPKGFEIGQPTRDIRRVWKLPLGLNNPVVSMVGITEVFSKTALGWMVINIQVRSKLAIMVIVSQVFSETDVR